MAGHGDCCLRSAAGAGLYTLKNGLLAGGLKSNIL